MKKLITLIITILVTSTSFSQTVTKQDTIVPLKIPIAKLVIKDLIRGDGAIQQVDGLNKIINMKDHQISLYKQKDTIKDEKIENLNLIIIKKDGQYVLEKEKSENLLKELKSQRRKTFLYRVGTFIGIVSTSILLLK